MFTSYNGYFLSVNLLTIKNKQLFMKNFKFCLTVDVKSVTHFVADSSTRHPVINASVIDHKHKFEKL